MPRSLRLGARTSAVLTGIVVGLWAAGAAAQSFQGTVRGTVRDAQGVIPGATVTLINQSTGATRVTTSNGVGAYSFPAVDPTRYTLKVEVPGFRTYENTNLSVGTQAQLDILPGGRRDRGERHGHGVAADRHQQRLAGDVLDAWRTRSPDRRPQRVPDGDPPADRADQRNAHWNRMQDQVGNSAMSMGGGAVRANNFLVDGFPVTDLQNRASTNPTIEAVQDMKVQVHTYDSEMGRTGGGVMNMTAKSGSNRFTRRATACIRPESMVAELLIPKLKNQPNVPEYWRDGGGGGGGPIVKNKMFFWIAGEKYVDNQPQQNSFLVPTAAERTGDFAACTRSGNPVDDQGSADRTAVPGQRHSRPTGSNPVGAKLASYFPTPNSQVDNGAQNFSMTDLLPNQANQITTKVDHHFNESVALSGFFLRQVTHEANANYNPVNKFVGGSYSARSRHQDLRRQQHLHPELVDRADAARRLQQVR